MTRRVKRFEFLDSCGNLRRGSCGDVDSRIGGIEDLAEFEANAGNSSGDEKDLAMLVEGVKLWLLWVGAYSATLVWQLVFCKCWLRWKELVEVASGHVDCSVEGWKKVSDMTLFN